MNHDELKDINYASSCLSPELPYLIGCFQKESVLTMNIDSNSLSDFTGWVDAKRDLFLRLKHSNG